jgi:hypothetical protein
LTGLLSAILCAARTFLAADLTRRGAPVALPAGRSAAEFVWRLSKNSISPALVSPALWDGRI